MFDWVPAVGAGFTAEDVIVRLTLATACGLVLGLDRELRGIARA